VIIIGELINGMFKDVGRAIVNKESDVIQHLAQDQVKAGATVLDVNTGPYSKNPKDDMKWLVENIQKVADVALALDSTKADVIEEGLKLVKKRAIINSTNVDDTDALMQASATIKKMIESSEYPMLMKNELIEAYRSLSYNDVSVPQAIELITAGRDFALVAIRSSATAEDLPTASFAGQQATFLNVKGDDALIQKLKECWASLYGARVIYYRAKKGFLEAPVIAVVVQKMVNSEKSGVIFTTNPTLLTDQYFIQHHTKLMRKKLK